MKQFNLIAVTALSLAAACSINTGGVGQMQNGAPISGNIGRNMDEVTFTVLSARGWQCSGTTKADFDLTTVATRTIPLSCSDGAKGNGIVALNQYSNQATMTFALDDGREGSVAFGSM